MLTANTNQFDVIERGTGRGSQAGTNGFSKLFRQRVADSAEQSDLAKSISGGKIIQDPFVTAVRLAIAGNVIDFGLRRAEEEVYLSEAVRDALGHPLAVDDTGALRRALEHAGRVLYIGDNAGEIVFDQVLIENLPNALRPTFVVRGIPIINDVTLEDAAEVGMEEVADVVSSGSAVPGTIIEEAPPEFRRLFDRADVVIAKGQGNYETLSGSRKRNLFFLLKAKCPVIAAHIGCELGGMVVEAEPAPAPGN